MYAINATMPSMPNVIAICGLKRCGKDTVAEYISSKYGHRNVKIASKLKHVVKILFDFSENQVETDAKDMVDPRWGITPRSAMQFIGTEMFQYKVQELLPSVGRLFWMESFIKAYIKPGCKVVISDMRFYHEYDQLKKHGAYIIKISRPVPSCATTITDTHSSEMEFERIPADAHITNDGSLDSLYRKIDNLIKKNS